MFRRGFYNLIDRCLGRMHCLAWSTRVRRSVWSLRFSLPPARPTPESRAHCAFLRFRRREPAERAHIVADPPGKCEVADEAPHGRLNFSPIWIFESRYVTRRSGWPRGPHFVPDFRTSMPSFRMECKRYPNISTNAWRCILSWGFLSLYLLDGLCGYLALVRYIYVHVLLIYAQR